MNRYKLNYEWKDNAGHWHKAEEYAFHWTAQEAYNEMCHSIMEVHDEWRDYAFYKLTNEGWAIMEVDRE